MAERVFADRADRKGTLRWGVADRAYRVTISVAAGHAAFEAPSTTAVALRFAVLFDDRERACRPRAPVVGDCDNLISNAGLHGSSCGTCAGRKSERGTHDPNRARILGVVIATRPGAGALADCSRRGRRGRLQFGICAGHPETGRIGLRPDDARLDPNRRHRVPHSNIAMDLAAAPVGDRVGDHGGNGRFRRHQPWNADCRPSFCSSADLDPVHLHSAHLDDRFGRPRFWRLAVGRDIDRRVPRRGVRRLSRASGEAGAAPSKPAIHAD